MTVERSEAQAPVNPGDVLAGRYRVLRVLAAGGMGVVVAAEHVSLGQKVAVKFLLKPVPPNSDMAQRFTREAKAAALLRSEHVARVIDVGTLETGAPYLVMEFLEGHDLQSIVESRGPLPIEEAVDYVLQALEGVGEAHTTNIVHRDLKPANLFCTHRADGSPLIKVLDFGISKVDEVAGGMTSTTTVLGSPLYMSPEQMDSAKRADQRSDVWSMGVVLYQLLTASLPFVADTLAGLCVAIATREAIAPRALRPDIPVELEQVILRCMAKSQSDRFQNVAELASALAPFAPRSAHHAERLQRLFKLIPGAGASGPYPAAQGSPLAASHSARISVDHSDALGATALSGALSVSQLKPAKPSRAPIFIGVAIAGAAVVSAVVFVLLHKAPSANATAPSTTPTLTTSAPPPTQTAPTAVTSAPTAAVTSAPQATTTGAPIAITKPATKPVPSSKPSAQPSAPASTITTTEPQPSATHAAPTSTTEFSNTRK